MTDPEIPLSGGTLTPVVRVGDTVRRGVGEWTPAVHDLLRHVRARGFDLAPEPIGFDEQGREMLRFIAGETVGWQLPWPGWIRSDPVLAEVGRALADYHAAVADFRPPPGARWQSGAGSGPVVCHNDFAPYNAVLSGGRLRGIIDWDLAGPGPAVSDLAFTAWQWVPLHGPMVAGVMGWRPEVDRGARLRLLLDSYGWDDRAGFVDAARDRVTYNHQVMVTRAAQGDARYQALVDQGHLFGMEEALRYLDDVGLDLQRRIET